MVPYPFDPIDALSSFHLKSHLYVRAAASSKPLSGRHTAFSTLAFNAFNIASAGDQEASYLTDELSRRAEDTAPAGGKPLAGQRLKTRLKPDFT